MNAVVPSRPLGNDHAVPGKDPCEQRLAPMREHNSAMARVDVAASTCPYRDAGPRAATWIGESLASERPLRPQAAALKLAHDQHKARAGLVDEKAERACVAAQGAAVASHAAPIQSMAVVFAATEPEVAIGGWCRR
jgi:hypothetical protein